MKEAAMAQKAERLAADVVIIGGGPGGCTLARELSKRGKRVVLVEKGRDDARFLGNGVGMLLRMEKGMTLPLPLKHTQEGDTVILAQCLGGGTLLYAGAAAWPDLRYWRRHGIELAQDLIDEAVKESWVGLPPDDFIGQGTRRVWESAKEAGIPFEKLHRHIDFRKCRPDCDHCLDGCLKDAKWTAVRYAREAASHGAVVLTNTAARSLIIEGGVAGGIKAEARNGREYDVEAKVVVCSAGGTDTARLLQRCGFPEAGRWFTGDPTFFTFGFVKREDRGNGGEHPMAVGWHDEEHKVLFCSMAEPKLAWHLQLVQDERFRALARLRSHRRVLGVFAKVSDDGVGKVGPNGAISKTFTEEDRRRFEYSRGINTRILVKAGCDQDDIHHSGFVMGHPSGTLRVGQLLSTDLETPVKNLYCCDTSVFPEAPGLPPALTIVVLAKRLARRLEHIV
jgi:choline dehydrogenase-like flavoprotein